MRTNGMSSAAAALRYWERRQEVTANNLANVETSGFKAKRVFARMIDDALPVADTVSDMRVGTLRPTGNPLDLALDGPGFLVVDTAAGERHTRGGAFRLDPQGQIVDANGNALLGEEGPIVVPGGTAVEIGRDGIVRADGTQIDRLRMERQPDGPQLVNEGANLFVPGGARDPLAPESRSVRQGFLEDSNVGTIDSMVDMISIQRAYQSVQKTMVVLDEIRRTISNDLGKPV
jgi:flagellar basal-body rod protein FlgF